jgi:hypothetical protein
MKSGTTVVGVFPDRESAERGIRQLQAAGFPREQIGVAARDRSHEHALAERTDSQAAEGAAAGAVGGGMLGGLVGLLVGVGALAIPGIGPVLAGGALASVLGVAAGTAAAGAGIGAATGGLAGALVGMGVSEEHARHFDNEFRAGGVLVTVTAGGRMNEARTMMEQNGADVGPWSTNAGRISAPHTRVSGGGRLGSEEEGYRGMPDRRSPVQRGRRRTDAVQPAIRQ